MNRDDLNALSRKIIGAAIEVHSILGPELLEKFVLCNSAPLR